MNCSDFFSHNDYTADNADNIRSSKTDVTVSEVDGRIVGVATIEE